VILSRRRGAGIAVPRLPLLLVLPIVLSVTACASRHHAAVAPAARTSSTLLSETLESKDPQLAAALLYLASVPTAEAHRSVAREYRRLAVLDLAHAHFTKAVELDPKDWASLDALARIWRDWGFPAKGLGDAYRARHIAPNSPIVANTIGTLLQAIGQVRSARQWYMRALNLDPTATYAMNNVCYALIMLQEPDAVASCRAAVAAEPRSSVTRNNLALAYAASGDLKQAREEFGHRGVASERYNAGMVYMSFREYRKAVTEFGSALQMNPQSTLAAERARQARIAADAVDATR